MLNLDHLRTFHLVLEHGSFSRAAETLQVGQSTVSFQIKSLESALGAKLIDRRGRSIRATPAGRLLSGYARRLLVLAQEAGARVRSEETGAFGNVTIAASTIPAEYLLPSLLSRLRDAHAEVSARVEVSDSRKAAKALLAEESDLALVGARYRDERIEWTPFAEDEIILIGPSRGAHATTGLPRGGLGAIPLVLREPGSGTRDAIMRLLPPGFEGARRRSYIEIGSTEAARRCVLEGLGYTFISRIAVADDLAAGQVRLVKLAGTPVRRTFYVGRLRGITMPASAKALLSLIAADRRERTARSS